jgi:nucleoside phosphorylase
LVCRAANNNRCILAAPSSRTQKREGGCGSSEKEQQVVPFTASLPRLPPELWQRIDRALANLDACMAAPPSHLERIETDAAYVERLAVALKEAGAAITAARLKNDVFDGRSWPGESQAETWARALLQHGFDPALTSEALAGWLGQTNDEGEQPGGDPVFFGLMRSSLSAFATAFRRTTGSAPARAQTTMVRPIRTAEQPVTERLRDAIQELLFFSTYRNDEDAAACASAALRTIKAADIGPPGHLKETWLHQFKVDAFKLYGHITASELEADELCSLLAAMKKRQDELWAMSPAPDNGGPEPLTSDGMSAACEETAVPVAISTPNGPGPTSPREQSLVTQPGPDRPPEQHVKEPNPFRQLCALALRIREEEVERDLKPARQRPPHTPEYRATLENTLRDLVADCCMAARCLGDGREREAEEAAQQLAKTCKALLVWEAAERLGMLSAEEATREKGGPCVALCNRLGPLYDRVDHLARLYDRVHMVRSAAGAPAHTAALAPMQTNGVGIMSETPSSESLREQARALREQKEAGRQASLKEEERLNRCVHAAAELGKAVGAMRCASGVLNPAPTAAELEEHCNTITPLLEQALAALGEADLLQKLDRLDEAATLGHYRQQRDDPEETRLAYGHAKQIIATDPADHERLAQLVRDAVEEPGLRRTWDWVHILVAGLIGQQKVVWQDDPRPLLPNPTTAVPSPSTCVPIPDADAIAATAKRRSAARARLDQIDANRQSALNEANDILAACQRALPGATDYARDTIIPLEQRAAVADALRALWAGLRGVRIDVARLIDQIEKQARFFGGDTFGYIIHLARRGQDDDRQGILDLLAELDKLPSLPDPEVQRQASQKGVWDNFVAQLRGLLHWSNAGPYLPDNEEGSRLAQELNTPVPAAPAAAVFSSISRTGRLEIQLIAQLDGSSDILKLPALDDLERDEERIAIAVRQATGLSRDEWHRLRGKPAAEPYLEMAIAALEGARKADDTTDASPRPAGSGTPHSAAPEPTAPATPTTGRRRPSMRIDEIRGNVDVGIITIREDEFRAVLQRLTSRSSVAGGRQLYDYARVTTHSSEALGVAVVRCLEQGQGDAQSVTQELIDDLNPPWLFLVGIGGGIPRAEFSLGDVILASRLIDFSVSAALQDQPPEFNVGGGPMHPDVENLLKHLPALATEIKGWNYQNSVRMRKPPIAIPEDRASDCYYGDDAWKQSVQSSLKRNFPVGRRARPPKSLSSPTISSNTLVKDADLLRQWGQSARHASAVEMELGGVYRAAHRGGKRNYRIVAVRGVSDIVGFKRSSEWTDYACHSAAAFACALLRSGVLHLLQANRPLQ